MKTATLAPPAARDLLALEREVAGALESLAGAIAIVARLKGRLPDGKLRKANRRLMRLVDGCEEALRPLSAEMEAAGRMSEDGVAPF